MKYIFKIDKEISFVYWIQGLIEWGFYFDERYKKGFLETFGEFSQEQIDVLEKLKGFLQKNDTGFLWLWQRYNKEPLNKPEELLLWQDIEKMFTGPFDQIWSVEYKKLVSWQKELQNYNYNKLNNFYDKVNKLFSTKYGEAVTVILNIGFSNKSPSGHTKKEFPNLILLNISSVPLNNIDESVSVLVHESIHLIDNNSQVDTLLRNSFKKAKVSLKTKIKKPDGPSWRHMVSESVLSSLAGLGFGYLEQNILDIEDKNSYNQFISKNKYFSYVLDASRRIVPITSEYMDSGKAIDDKFADGVINIWFDLVKPKQD